jgi:hypothetical protein
MPDSWEQANGLQHDFAGDATLDADNDGMRNRDEYVAGTDPQNSGSYLKVEQLTVGGTVTIEFSAMAGKTYSVQYKNDLGAIDWTRLLNVGARPTNSVQVITDPAPAPNRFYRLVTPRD